MVMVEDVRTKLAAFMNKLFVMSARAKDVPPVGKVSKRKRQGKRHDRSLAL